MREMPVVEAFFVDSREDPSGMGEQGVPCTAPAVANAIFAATGKRVRKLPIRLAEVRG
jgi:isoquinoline 1-oxidoreductase beta subunit